MAHAFGTVVVLGGSMGGMLAAAALARSAEQVMVIERDALDGEAVARKGVPQARHNHNLFAGGRELIERLLPGVTADLRARGAIVEDSGATGRWIIGGYRLARVETGSAGVLASRPCIDAAILGRLRALPNVTIMDRTDVLGVVADARRERIVGVRTASRADESGERTIDADLVIDATGRGSRTPAWLEALGHRAPEADELEVRVAYATRVFPRKPSDLGGDRHVIVSGVAPDHARGGLALAVEGDRWMILLFGYGGTRPPTELEGFRAYAGSVAPELAEVAAAAPLDDGVVFSYPRAMRRRYDRLSMPEGLLAFGDALVSTNPCWGAGMTSAAQQAGALERCLAGGARGLSRRWHAAGIAATEDLWASTTNNDRAYACVDGAPAAPHAVIRRYVGALCAGATSDPILARTMIRLIDRVGSPASMFAPSIVLRVARGALARRRLGALAVASASRILGA